MSSLIVEQQTSMAFGLASGATFSADRRYRYRLWRSWGNHDHRCVFVGLNPSVADETNDDMTITKCVGFAKRWGFGAVDMVNLFAFVSTNPAGLLRTVDPVGNRDGVTNDQHLESAFCSAHRVVFAWGQHNRALRALIRDRSIHVTSPSIPCRQGRNARIDARWLAETPESYRLQLEMGVAVTSARLVTISLIESSSVSYAGGGFERVSWVVRVNDGWLRLGQLAKRVGIPNYSAVLASSDDPHGVADSDSHASTRPSVWWRSEFDLTAPVGTKIGRRLLRPNIDRARERPLEPLSHSKHDTYYILSATGTLISERVRTTQASTSSASTVSVPSKEASSLASEVLKALERLK